MHTYGVRAVARALILAYSMLLPTLALASDPPATPPAEPATDPHQQEAEAAWEAAYNVLVPGPAKIALREQASLELPAGYGFVRQSEAARLMKLMGNYTDDRFIGLILPLGEDTNWLVTLDYEPSGFIKDDDAKHWDAEELLTNLKEGTEAGNEEREKMGIAPIKVTRWIEPPGYEAAAHRLVWSAEVKLKEGQDDDPGVNYNTYVLGREGYISLNLVTSAATVDKDKADAHTLLAAINFNDGKRYTDFNASTDKVAAFGLAALVGGVAAKKLGLLAIIAATVAKFFKVILIAVAAFGAGIMKWFKGKRAGNSASNGTDAGGGGGSGPAA
jgi:uncharacterized membrane-anchored protein